MVALKCHYKNYLPSVTAISCHGRGTKIFFQAHLFELANLQNSGLIEHRPASDLISVPFKLGFSRVPVNNAIGLLPSLLSKLFKREVDLSFVKIYQKHDKGIIPIYLFYLHKNIISKKFTTDNFFRKL